PDPVGFAWVALPARCGSGRGYRRSWARWPLPEPPQHGSIGRVGQQTQGAPGQTGRETVGWPGLSVRLEEAMRIQTPPWLVAGPPTAAASTSAPSADGYPRRTLVAAPPARGPTATDDPISRRSVLCTDSLPPGVGSGLAASPSGAAASRPPRVTAPRAGSCRCSK